MKYVKLIAKFIWVLPFNLLFGVIPLLIGWYWLRFEGVISSGSMVFTPKPGSWLAKKWGATNWAGFAWCPVAMFLYTTLLPSTIRHEQQHQRQQVLFGVFFYALYTWSLFALWLEAKISPELITGNKTPYMHSYHANIFEREAYEVQDANTRV